MMEPSDFDDFNDSGFFPGEEQQKPGIPDAAACAALLNAFTDATKGMQTPASMACCPAWFNDVYWFSSQEIGVGDILLSNVDEGDEMSAMVETLPADRIDAGRKLLGLMNGELDYGKAARAMGVPGRETVIRFIRMNDSRIFMHAWESNGDYGLQCEISGDDLLIWNLSPYSSNVDTGFPDPEDAERVSLRLPDSWDSGIR